MNLNSSTVQFHLEARKSKGEHIIDVLAFVTVGLLAGIGIGLLVAKKPGAQPGTELRAAVNDALSPPKI